MAGVISPQPLAVGETLNKNENIPKKSYANLLRQKEAVATSSTNFNLCPITVVHGEHTIEFTMDEVNEFTREEWLHQAAVLKFSYGKPDLQEIRRSFSTQFDIGGNCNIGLLEYRHLLVRFDLYSDYVKFISRSTGYLKSKGNDYFFRTFPWTIKFNPKEETSMAVVWISMPGLPANFFAKRALMSIASTVGKALAVDKATQDRTRPSTARVKVLLDLLDERPKKVKLRIVDKVTGKSVNYYQEIVYDNLPSYCCHCSHQGHDERSFRILKDKTDQNIEGTVRQTSNNITGSTSADQQKGNEKQGQQALNLQKLQGDARDFLNAKRAEQKDNESDAKEIVNSKESNKQVDAKGKNKGIRNTVVQRWTKVAGNKGNQISTIEVGEGLNNPQTNMIVENEVMQKDPSTSTALQGDNNEGQQNGTTQVHTDVQSQEEPIENTNRFAILELEDPIDNQMLQLVDNDGHNTSGSGKKDHKKDNAVVMQSGRRNSTQMKQKDNTKLWVQNSFEPIWVDTNTSCQEIPSQDTRVLRHLDNKVQNEVEEELIRKENQLVELMNNTCTEKHDKLTVPAEIVSTQEPQQGIAIVQELQNNQTAETDEIGVLAIAEEIPKIQSENQMQLANHSNNKKEMQLLVNLPVKSPLQNLHDLATHNVEQTCRIVTPAQQMEEEGDDESTAATLNR